MGFLNGSKIRLLFVGFVAVIVFASGSAKADFTYGTPTNLGPIVNSHSAEQSVSISTDGLTLFFDSNRFNEYYDPDIWVTMRETASDPWEPPVHLGSNVNTSFSDATPSISADGLSLYFASDRPGESGELDIWDIWITTRETIEDEWMTPENLGRTVNIEAHDFSPSISADGLALYFASERPGGSGGFDIWVTMRETIQDPWGEPANLGPIVNTSSVDFLPSISADGLALFFTRLKDFSSEDSDFWVTRRTTVYDDWGTPVSLPINTLYVEGSTSISADGLELFFTSDRPGGSGDADIWQASIEPVVDFNGDGNINTDDLLILIDNWNTSEQLCDIGPMPWGDGVVDMEDLKVFIEYWEKENFPDVNVDDDDDGGQVVLKQGQVLVVTLESNPSTGYSWAVVENQNSILAQQGDSEFIQPEQSDPPMVGAGGWEVFRFKAISPGQETLELVYRRAWETDAEPANTFSIDVVVN